MNRLLVIFFVLSVSLFANSDFDFKSYNGQKLDLSLKLEEVDHTDPIQMLAAMAFIDSNEKAKDFFREESLKEIAATAKEHPNYKYWTPSKTQLKVFKEFLVQAVFSFKTDDNREYVFLLVQHRGRTSTIDLIKIDGKLFFDHNGDRMHKEANRIFSAIVRAKKESFSKEEIQKLVLGE